MLNYKAFFTIKNYNETDVISCVAVGDIHIVRLHCIPSHLVKVIGTNEGKLYQINIESGNIVNVFQAHTKKITNIYIKEYSAIISTSYDSYLKITTLCPEFDNMQLELNEYELSCFSLRAQSFNASQIEFFIGTALGKLFYFYNGWL